MISLTSLRKKNKMTATKDAGRRKEEGKAEAAVDADVGVTIAEAGRARKVKAREDLTLKSSWPIMNRR